jgi:hypothetical protein
LHTKPPDVNPREPGGQTNVPAPSWWQVTTCAVVVLLIIAVVIPTAPRPAIASTKNIVVLISFIGRIIFKKVYRK